MAARARLPPATSTTFGGFCGTTGSSTDSSQRFHDLMMIHVKCYFSRSFEEKKGELSNIQQHFCCDLAAGAVSRQSVTSRGAIARLGLAADKAETPATSEEDGTGWDGGHKSMLVAGLSMK